MPGLSADKAARLVVQAESYLANCHVEPATLLSCDVLVCCDESTDQAERAILSVLAQEGVVTIVHLVDDGGGGAALVRRFAGRWNVVTHETPAVGARSRPCTTSCRICDRSSWPFKTRRRSATPSGSPPRSACLFADGAEILAAPLQTPSGIVRPRRPGRAYRRYLTSPTLVFRRASLLDMGGIAPDRADSDAELIFRAATRAESSCSRRAGGDDVRTPGARAPWAGPAYEPRAGSLRHHAIGYPDEPVESDVVIPFHGFLHFLRQSLPSMIEQQGGRGRDPLDR